MGCVSSKHMKRQEPQEDGLYRNYGGPVMDVDRHTSSVMESLETVCYQKHFVALTSSSYGLLKIESPGKHLADSIIKEKKTPTKHIGLASNGNNLGLTLTEMYGKLTVEMAHTPDLKKHHESPLQQLDAQLRSLWMQQQLQFHVDSGRASPLTSPSPTLIRQLRFGGEAMQSRGLGGSSNEFVISSETINVGDMMMGLEDAAAPSRSAPISPLAYQKLINSPLDRRLSVGPNSIKTIAMGIKNPSTYSNYSSPVRKKLITPTKFAITDDVDSGKENAMHFNDLLGFKQPNTPSSALRSPLAIKSQVLKTSLTPSPLSKTALSSAYRKPYCVDKSLETMASSCTVSPPQYITNTRQDKNFSHTTPRTPLRPKIELTVTPVRRSNFSPPTQQSSRRTIVTGLLIASPTQPNSPLFDPDLVASYEQALESSSQHDWNTSQTEEDSSSVNHVDHQQDQWIAESVSKEPSEGLLLSYPVVAPVGVKLERNLYDPFHSFEKKCPPGGGETRAVLYTTTLRGIRKTFEDCNTVRDILHSFELKIDERDVSMHLGFLNELRQLVGNSVSVPRLFIKGRYIGDIDQVVKLYEEGTLSELVEGLPKDPNGSVCDGCGGIRFVPCLDCNGSCKLRKEDIKSIVRCPECNENGLIQCPICV